MSYIIKICDNCKISVYMKGKNPVYFATKKQAQMKIKELVFEYSDAAFEIVECPEIKIDEFGNEIYFSYTDPLWCPKKKLINRVLEFGNDEYMVFDDNIIEYSAKRNAYGVFLIFRCDDLSFTKDAILDDLKELKERLLEDYETVAGGANQSRTR